MAGEIEEPFRLNFQADLLHSGSISFGRFESESLSWERRSVFSHNRYLEDVEKYSKPGSVTEKKAYFEAEFRRKALLKQRSSECQDGGEFPTDRNNNLHDLEDSGNGGESRHITYSGDSPCSFDEFEYNRETEAQQHEKGNFEALNAENGNGSRHVARFDERPHNSGYDEDTTSQEYETQNCGFLPIVTQDEPVIKTVKCPVSVPNCITFDETHHSETENVTGNAEESIEVTLIDKVTLMDVTSEVNDSSLSGQTLKKDDDSTTSGPRRIFSPQVKPAPEKKLTRATFKTQGNVDRPQKLVSNETSKGSMKPRTSESKGLPIKKTEKKSPRPASPLSCSGVKTSKVQEIIASSKEKELRQKKSILKDLRSEKAVKTQSSLSHKSLPGISSTVNRPKPSISSSKSHIIQSTEGFSFKTDQRAEHRKEFYMKIAEKMHAKEVEVNQVEAKTQEKQAAEMKQLRRSLNFKATPLPSFYNESTRGSNQHKVTAMSKTLNQARPSSQSAASRRDKNGLKPCVPSVMRPRSSSTNRIRPLEDVRRNNVPEKKKETILMKHKEAETRGKDNEVRKHVKGTKSAVGVAS